MAQRPPWLRGHRGSDATVAQTPPWLRRHRGSDATVAQRPPWLRRHRGSDATVAQRPPWLRGHRIIAGPPCRIIADRLLGAGLSNSMHYRWKKLAS